MPIRIQRKRTKGFRLPPGCIYVGRPGPWGNPFPLSGSFIVWYAVSLGLRADAAGRREAAVRGYRAWLTGENAAVEPLPPACDRIVFESGVALSTEEHGRGLAAAFTVICGDRVELPRPPALVDLATLRGRDLACWCPLDLPCHADVLLELANR